MACKLLAVACGFQFPDQGLNPSPCTGSTESLPVDHQGSACWFLLSWSKCIAINEFINITDTEVQYQVSSHAFKSACSLVSIAVCILNGSKEGKLSFIAFSLVWNTLNRTLNLSSTEIMYSIILCHGRLSGSLWDFQLHPWPSTHVIGISPQLGPLRQTLLNVLWEAKSRPVQNHCVGVIHVINQHPVQMEHPTLEMGVAL